MPDEPRTNHSMVGSDRSWLEWPPSPVYVGWRKESEARPDEEQKTFAGRLWSVFEAGDLLKSYLCGK